ncbi:MAG: HPP family protein [Synergistaceae bacterium]|nr:HPP family protein [Synergistaceae bacterium]
MGHFKKGFKASFSSAIKLFGRYSPARHSRVSDSPRLSPISRLKLFAGPLFGFAVIAFISFREGFPSLIAPFASSACILFASHDGRYAQPKNIILGHSLSAAVGVASNNFSVLAGDAATGWLVAVLCVGVSMALMDATDTLHPPAAATSLVAHFTRQGWTFVLWPTAVAAFVVVLSAWTFRYSYRASHISRTKLYK